MALVNAGRRVTRRETNTQPSFDLFTILFFQNARRIKGCGPHIFINGGDGNIILVTRHGVIVKSAVTDTGYTVGSTYNDSADLTPTFTVTDNVSGAAGIRTSVTLDGQELPEGTPIPLYTLPLGDHTLTVTATDLAGNTSSQSITFKTAASADSLKSIGSAVPDGQSDR